ncbi:MAG: ATP-binding protein [Chloroflexota bacterium]
MTQSSSTVTNQQPTFKDLELLVEVSQLLTLRDLAEVVDQVMQLAASAVGAAKASLFLHNGENIDWNYVFTARNLDGADSVRVVNKVMDEGLAGWVVKNKQSAIVVDTETDERWHVFPDDVLVVRSAICVPLMLDDEVIAVLTLVHPEADHFNDYHLRLMTIIANQASVAIRNAQLFQTLQERQDQLQAVLQSVPDVMLVLNENDDIIHVNEGAASILGAEHLAEARGMPLAHYAAQIDILEQVREYLADEPPADNNDIKFEARSIQLETDFAVTISTWEHSTTERHGHVVLIHNVTTLRDLYRFKDEMLRIVSHDLRSPLSIISGYADMVEYDIPPESVLHEYTDAIKRSVTRMSTLLEDLLKVRQIDEKGLHLDTDTVMLDLVLPVVQGTAMLAYQKQQTVESDVKLDESVRGTVDTTLMRQAFDNLASNAVKYTPEGGTIHIRSYVEDDHLCFEVQDNGIGIPEDSLPHLFESFYRVNPDRNTTISGAGLGLSLVKSIVERHHGQVWVTSEEGQGSLFGIRIPLK